MPVPTDVSPFTPQKVHEILRDTVLTSDSPLPPVGAREIANLAHMLTALWWIARGWAGPYPEEVKRIAKIQEAIQTLTEILPELREDTAATLVMFKRWDQDPQHVEADIAADNEQQLEADIAGYDALIAAAWAARDRGLPKTVELMIVTSKPITRWNDFATELQAFFLSQLPEASKSAAYRLIEAVAPDITGDKPHFRTIQSAPHRKSD